MARFPDSELQRVKREVDLVVLVESSGVKLRRHGRDWLGLCPFHDDREPSLVVTPAKGLWHCLGACQAGGTAIDWVMKSRELSFREAVVALTEWLGATPGALREASSSRPRRAVATPAHSPELLDEVVSHYQACLAASEEARGYAASRLISPEAVEAFRIGYADRSLGRVLSEQGAEGGAKREALKELGVLRPTSGHEHLAGCLVIPVIEVSGRVENLYGRRIREAGNTPKHLYLPGPRRGVFNFAGVADAQRGELILCESLIDALTFWSHGFRQVTCTWGVNGLTEELVHTIRVTGVARVLVAYDRDKAGDEAAAKVAETLGASGVGCFRVAFPRGMDANDYARKVTPAKESLALALASATWMAGPKHHPLVAAVIREPEAEPSPLAAAPARPAEAEVAAKEETSSAPAEAVPSGAGADPLERTVGDRRWRIRGLAKNLSYEKLQVLVRVACGDHFFVDAVDLVAARQRAGFLKQAAVELSVKEELLRRDLAQLHLELELAQDQLIARELAGKEEKAPALTPEAERLGLELLRRPDLLETILADFSMLGIVGEEANKLLGYLAAVSRLLDRPLAVLVQSSSAAGKSALLEAILSMVPEEERVQYSGVTGQALFYLGEQDLKHKVLAIAEEEGAERAAYALKLLQSEGELTIASTGKDPTTGKLTTHEYRVEGPVALLMTTTAIEVDEELLNRCLVLTVDETQEQTRAIHERQREAETLEGLLAQRERQQILERHRNAQRLLKPLLVANPYARELTFLDDRTRRRRDHVKYLTLIRAIALLHQYQRSKKRVEHAGEGVEYIEVTREDIRVANRLASEALGTSLDELPPQTRRFLERLHAWVRETLAKRDGGAEAFLFSRRAVREALGWGDTQVRKHLERLVELEYVLVHRGTRGQRYVYELAWDGEGSSGERFLMGLLDVEKLPESERGIPEAATSPPSATASPPSEATSPPQGPEFAPPSPPGRPPFALRSRGARNGRNDLTVQSLRLVASSNDPDSTSGEVSDA